MGKFKVKKAKTGFMFDLTGGNGEVIGTSEIYTTREKCMQGIDSVRKFAPKAKVVDLTAGGTAKSPSFEIFTDKARQFLKASNGEIILASEGYKAKAGCKNGIDSVMRNAPEAKVVEEEMAMAR